MKEMIPQRQGGELRTDKILDSKKRGRLSFGK